MRWSEDVFNHLLHLRLAWINDAGRLGGGVGYRFLGFNLRKVGKVYGFQ